MKAETDMKRTSFSDKRLDRACDYVSDMWFPTNPTLEKKIFAALQDNEQTDLDTLVGEIRGDYSLYIYCLKELCGMLREEGANPEISRSPLDLFRWGGVERLRSILEAKDHSAAPHSFETMTEAQRRRLEDSIVSASSAQVLAKHNQIDPQLGFSAGLLRQLGMTLIAWNYPSIYERALAEQTERNTIDTRLSQLLGFSPAMLAMALAHRWGLPDELCDALENEIDSAEEMEEALEVEAIGSMLANLCRIGETLARANNPVDYPSARADWLKAQQEISSQLGTEGISVIQSAVAENCLQYTITTPNFFKPGGILDPEAHIRDFVRGSSITSNPYVDSCLSPVKENLLKLYKMIEDMVSSEEALRLLVRDIVPQAGFTGGAVYTIEPSTSLLVPQLRIKNLSTREMVPLTAQPTTTEQDLVTLAYQTAEPVIRSAFAKDTIRYTTIAGLFGFIQRVGVLYLEMPEESFERDPEANTLHFQAIAQALNDSLELR